MKSRSAKSAGSSFSHADVVVQGVDLGQIDALVPALDRVGVDVEIETLRILRRHEVERPELLRAPRARAESRPARARSRVHGTIGSAEVTRRSRESQRASVSSCVAQTSVAAAERPPGHQPAAAPTRRGPRDAEREERRRRRRGSPGRSRPGPSVASVGSADESSAMRAACTGFAAASANTAARGHAPLQQQRDAREVEQRRARDPDQRRRASSPRAGWRTSTEVASPTPT